MSKFAGAEWLKANKVKNISPFGERVADLLGYMCQGIYHLDGIEKRDWSSADMIEITYHEVSTFDYSDLTRLVLLAHRMAIRISIIPAGRYLKIQFSVRTREGSVYERHPTIEEAIEKFNADCYLPVE
jgi:hypothetical protein